MHFLALAVSTPYRPDNRRVGIYLDNLAIFLIFAMPHCSSIYLGKMSSDSDGTDNFFLIVVYRGADSI